MSELHYWVGWYSQLGANTAKPSTIRWTRGPTGDSFAEVKAALERKHPGRVHHILVRGATPGLAHCRKKWKEPPGQSKRFKLLACVTKKWITINDLARLHLARPVQRAPAHLRLMVDRLVQDGYLEVRRASDPDRRGIQPLEYRRSNRAV